MRKYSDTLERNDRDSLRFLQYRRRAFTYSRSVHKPSHSLDKESYLSRILPLLLSLARHHRSFEYAHSLLLRSNLVLGVRSNLFDTGEIRVTLEFFESFQLVPSNALKFAFNWKNLKELS